MDVERKKILLSMSMEATITLKMNLKFISNTHSQVCVAGGFDRVVVDYAETSGGVKVAWKNGLYVSVKNDEKVTSIVLCSEFATHYGYIQPTKY